MAKVLITGASGFVGSWLVKEALNRDHDTYAGVRSTSKRDLLQDDRINFVEIDFGHEANLREILRSHQFDVIIHNAGVTREAKDSTYFRVNSEYTALLAKAAKEELGTILKKFIFISSIEAFGSADPTPEKFLDRQSIPQPRTTYGKSKLRAESALKTIEDLPLIILRPTAVFGPAEKDIFKIWETIKRYRFAPVIGDSNIKYTFVYVKDLVRVVLDAAFSDIVRREYFVSDGKIYKISEFTGHVANSLGIRPFGFTIPYSILELAVIFTKMKDKLTGTKSLLNEEQLAKMKAKTWDCDISELSQDLDFQAQFNLQQAIEETTEWYRKNGWL